MALPHGSILSLQRRLREVAAVCTSQRELLQKTLELLGENWSSCRLLIALVNPNDGHLEAEAWRGWSTAWPPDLLHHGLPAWTLLQRKPLLLPRWAEESKLQIPATSEAAGVLAIPMLEHGTCMGVFYAESSEPGFLQESHLEEAETVLGLATLYLNRYWLDAQLRQKSRQLQGLVEASTRIVGSAHQEDIFGEITRQTRKIADCRVAAFFIFKNLENRLALHTLEGTAPHPEDALDFSPDESALGTVVHHCKQITVEDIRKVEELHFVHLAQQLGLQAYLATPLSVDQELCGVLVAYKDRRHRFSNDEKQLLLALAGIGSVAIHNYRLYARVMAGEDQLRRNERLTTLGLLAAEIAHEIRNPLTVLRLLFDSLDLQFSEQDPRQEDVRIIGEKLSQLEEIVQRVLHFGKLGETLHSRWDLRQLVSETLQLLRFKLQQARITTCFSTPHQPVMVLGHKGQLQQVFLNILINAVEAMPTGGAIELQVHPPEAEDTQAVLTIRDHGKGIPEEMRTRLFESFLTGKSGGTGLGLSIVRRILVDHHGGIEVLETSPAGTTIRIWLPLQR